MDVDRLSSIYERKIKMAERIFTGRSGVNELMDFFRMTLDGAQIVCGGITFAMLMKYVEHGLENGIIPNVAGLTLTSYK